MTLFPPEQSVRPFLKDPRRPFTEHGALRVFVRGESFLANCMDSLAVLASRAHMPSSASPNRFFRRTVLTPMHFRGTSLSASLLVHGLFLAIVVYAPRFFPSRAPARLQAKFREERIYYRLPLLNPQDLPRLAPSGPGGHSGSGSVAAPVPALGSTAIHPSLTIISRPLHPDNSRQTIYQPSSPPDLRIATEQKLPNIVSLPPVQAPKAILNLDIAKPVQTSRNLPQVAAPRVEGTPATPMTTLLKPSSDQPRLAIPLAGEAMRLQTPKKAPGDASDAPTAQPGDIVALGIEPVAPTDQISLPGGNRWGEFSIGPAGRDPGSPGGVASGIAGGGNGIAGPGGDASNGLGPGSSGGEGATPEFRGP